MSDTVNIPGARRRLPRTRGATSGLLLILLGVWGALIPFVGPSFDFAFTPDKTWKWTAARGWLEVLPGGVTIVGGLLLVMSVSRAMTVIAAWLAIAGGAWFVVGLPLADPLRLGSPGSPAGSGSGIRALESIAMFSGLGAIIVFIASAAFGRLSVVTQRDVAAAERRQVAAEAEEADAREAAQREAEGRGPNALGDDARGRHEHLPAGAADATGGGAPTQYPGQYPSQYPPSQYGAGQAGPDQPAPGQYGPPPAGASDYSGPHGTQRYEPVSGPADGVGVDPNRR